MAGLVSRRVERLAGEAWVPGDKSISHRALMLGALAVGETRIAGLLEGEDVHATARAIAAMGAEPVRHSAGRWSVHGVGLGGLGEPEDVLDMGNSGTSARLLMGVIAGHPIRCTMTGDASLRKRPMSRVIDPLSAMGAQISARSGGRLPLFIAGSDDPMPIDYRPPVASAQVKSAVLLAGLCTPGTTVVREDSATRDHTERMLAAMGAEIAVEETPTGGRIIALTGEPELEPVAFTVPGDISSAAFPLVASLLVPVPAVTVPGVGINPLRAGLLEALEQMGAVVQKKNIARPGGEPVADVSVAAPDGLKGVDLDPRLAPAMIDEFPILFVAAACAHGTSRFRGLAELRVKESDRIAAMAAGLAACGVAVEELEDGLVVHGTGRPPAGGATVATHLDHRIAMAFLCLGLVTEAPVAVDDAAAIATSFPGFVDLMNGLGAEIGPA